MTENNVSTISVHQLKKLCDTSQKLCLIDVREPHEWQELRIKEALHIPKGDLADMIQSKVPELNQPIYLHCRGGVRSIDAARILMNLGYKTVYSVDGGILEWERSGFPVEKELLNNKVD